MERELKQAIPVMNKIELLTIPVWLLCFFCALPLSAQHGTNCPTAANPVTLKVMTYNLRFGELASLEQLAAFIDREQPDLVALQEADWMTERERAPHQHHKDFVTELGYHTGMFPLFGKTIRHANGLYGIGILSRKPYTYVKKKILPKAPAATEYRALLLAAVELTDHDTIVFASTHLDYSSSQARVEQVASILNELRTAGHPVLIGGDFNARPGSQEIGMLLHQCTPCSNDQPTSPARQPKNKIDYLFGYPRGAWKLISSDTPASPLSDHLPIISVIELTNNPAHK